jgi:hypothetical protein
VAHAEPEIPLLRSIGSAGRSRPRHSAALTVETKIDEAQSTVGTLSDFLNDIPSVDVDPDGVVSLRGDYQRTDPHRRLGDRATNIVNLGYKHTLTPALAAVDGQRYQRLVSTPTLTQVYARSVVGRISYIG